MVETTQISYKILEQEYSSSNKKPFAQTLPSTRPFIWDCPKCDTDYQQTLKARIAGIGCPYCAGRKIKPGLNDISTLFPLLIQYWGDSNKPITKYGKGSQEKIKWCCPDCLLNWTTQVNVQVKKNPKNYCPYCSGTILAVGINDITVTHPDKASQYSKTNLLPVTDILSTSEHVATWVNNVCNHSWEQPIRNRVNSPVECPVCTGTKLQSGVNTLIDVKPYVKDFWDYNKNKVTFSELSPNSNQQVSLICPFGHSWVTTPARLTTKVTCQICANKTVIKGINDMATTHPIIAEQFHPTKNIPLTPATITTGTHTRLHWICSKGHEWSVKGNDRLTYKSGCPECIPFNSSTGENEIAAFLEGLGLTVERHKRKLISNELDIYVPDKQVAIEYNGLYWHDEKHKSKTYHYDKWLACKNAGIQLIQIWEDDWEQNQQLVKNMLAHKLGLNKQQSFPARKTSVVNLTQTEVDSFLKENHIQGTVKASIRVGLTCDNNLVAVMLFRREDKNRTLNLLRYATNSNVVGGFTKLLTHVELNETATNIVSFSDHCVSDGGLYEWNGFNNVQECPPDYMYVVKRQRKHKFGYRLKRFKIDVSLKYVEGLTERELAELNGLNRIWDAGKTKWAKPVKRW